MIPLRDAPEEVLTWTRPSFLELRYELESSKGTVARVSVSGMGESKHALAETAEGAWSFAVFPFAAEEVVITRTPDRAEEGRYLRKPPFEIHLANGSCYRLNATAGVNSRAILEDEAGSPIFEVEQREAFPRWKAEVKFSPGAADHPELALLVAWACCLRVFR